MRKRVVDVLGRIMMCATMFVLVCGIDSVAQPPWMNNSAEDMPKAFMEHEDANGDGKVTIDEFKGPDAEFNFFDRNGDGIIELSEAPTPDTLPEGLGHETPSEPETLVTVTINGVDFTIPYDVFSWAELPADVIYERQPMQSLTNAEGVTHYYEAVYVSSGNLNWYQAASLAQDAGGYLASITSEEENTFIFNLVSDPKYFWSFPEEGKHHGISIGPFLGGYQPEGSPEPDGGWSWLSGEAWGYTNWAKNLDDGVIDKDPRPNDQPNDSGQGQPIMGFGEMNLPVPTWGDYMEDVGTYGKTKVPGSSYGFIIEYESHPKK